MKKLMILGAGVYQVPLIKTAKNLGYKTIVLSAEGPYPGISIADIFVGVDTTDIDSILEEAKRFNISGILTAGSDVCVPAIGKVVDELELSGTGYDSAILCSNKLLMKEKLQIENIPAAHSRGFNDVNQAQYYAEYLGFPVMVKVPNLSGSKGIYKIDNVRKFVKYWNLAKDLSNSGELLVEEYLEGIEFGAQAVIYKNKVETIYFHNDTVSGGSINVPIGHSMPSFLSNDKKQAAEAIINQIVKLFNIKDCIANFDFIDTNDGIKIIEVAARIGGTCLPENISTAIGKNIYEALVRLAVGESTELSEVDKYQPNACLIIRSNRSGKVKRITIPEHIKNNPNVVQLKLDVTAGDYINKFAVGSDRVGHLIVKADSVEKAENLVSRLINHIKLEVA